MPEDGFGEGAGAAIVEELDGVLVGGFEGVLVGDFGVAGAEGADVVMGGVAFVF